MEGALDKISDGDELEIDYKAGVINNKTQKTNIKFKALPDFALDIIKDGASSNTLKNRNKSLTTD